MDGLSALKQPRCSNTIVSKDFARAPQRLRFLQEKILGARADRPNSIGIGRHALGPGYGIAA